LGAGTHPASSTRRTAKYGILQRESTDLGRLLAAGQYRLMSEVSHVHSPVLLRSLVLLALILVW